MDVGQQLYIAHMSGPTAIDSERVQISVPDRYWEQRGLPLQEGPVALTDEEKGTAILVYSASGSWTDAYCLGKLTLTGDDPMDPGSSGCSTMPTYFPAPAGMAAAAGRSRSSGTVRLWTWGSPQSPASRWSWPYLNDEEPDTSCPALVS